MPRHSLPAGGESTAPGGEITGGDESVTPLRPRQSSFMDGAAELLPQDLQEDFDELRRQPGMAALRASVALLSVLAVAGAVIALPWAAYHLYGFDKRELHCESEVADESRHAIETAIGAAPMQLRSFMIGVVVVQFCRKVTGARGDGIGLGRALLTMPSSEGDPAIISNAGWEAIVETQPQPSWGQVRDARQLTQRQSISSAVVKLLCWHWSQPVAFLWMLVPYRCDIASLGMEQRCFAAIVPSPYNNIYVTLFCMQNMYASMTCMLYELGSGSGTAVPGNHDCGVMAVPRVPVDGSYHRMEGSTRLCAARASGSHVGPHTAQLHGAVPGESLSQQPVAVRVHGARDDSNGCRYLFVCWPRGPRPTRGRRAESRPSWLGHPDRYYYWLREYRCRVCAVLRPHVRGRKLQGCGRQQTVSP